MRKVEKSIFTARMAISIGRREIWGLGRTHPEFSKTIAKHFSEEIIITIYNRVNLSI